MSRIQTPIQWALLALTGTVLISCGGGGGSATGSSSPSPSTPTVSGVAATGAPIAGAAITLTDANGKTVSTTAAADGSYSLDTTGLVAPFAIVASGAVGDAQTIQTSVVTTAPAAGTSSTVNINPLTTAIATAVSASSDPTAIVSSLSSVTSASIANATSILNQALGGLASASGANANFNPISDTVSANGTGLDRLMDNMTFSVQPGTGAILFAKDGITFDDMAATSTAPTPYTPNSNNALVLSNTSTAASALPGSLVIRDYTVANFLQSALNACFAISSSNGRASNALCTSALSTPDYLNNGKTITQDLSSWMTAVYDGATFSRPEIIRFYTPTRALVKLSGTRTDGVVFSLQTVIEKATVSSNVSTESANGTWQLVGNQRSYNVSISGMAMRQVELNSNYSIPSGYFSAFSPLIDITVNNLANTVFSAQGGNATNPGTSCSGSACSYVAVYGSGLPNNGLIYKRNTSNSSCNTQLVLATNLASTPSSCTSVYKINGIAVDPTKNLNAAFDSVVGNSQGGSIASIVNYSTTGRAAVDTTISGIAPFAPYVFKIFDGTTGNTTYIVEHLRGRPPTTAELANYKWLELSSATLNQMYSTGTNPFPGGASINISWTRSQFALPAYSSYTQFQSQTASLQSLSLGLPVSSLVGLVSATITNPNAAFPAAPTANQSSPYGGRSWIGLTAKDQTDTKIYSAWSYSN